MNKIREEYEAKINELSEYDRADFDERRFPKKWQAVLGAWLISPVGTVVYLAVLYFLGSDYKAAFRTDFGSEMFLYVLTQLAIMLPLPLIIGGLSKKDMCATLRINKGISGYQALLLIIISVCFFYAVQVINAVFVDGIFTAYFGPPTDSLDGEAAENIAQLLLEIVITAGLPAICEEIMFRGFALRAFERLGKVGAVVTSSVLFAIMHGTLQQLMYAFIFGLIFGTVAVITDSLGASMLMHFTLNTLSSFLCYKPISDWFTKFAEKNEALFTVAVVVALPVIGIIVSAVFIKHTVSENKKYYGKGVVSDFYIMKNAASAKRKGSIGYVILWILFIIANLETMYSAWYM